MRRDVKRLSVAMYSICPGQLEAAVFSRSNKAAALIQLTGSNGAQCHQRVRGRKAQIKHRTLILRLPLPRRSLRLGIAIDPTTTSSEREERWRDWRRSYGTISAPHLPRFAGSLPETFLAAFFQFFPLFHSKIISWTILPKSCSLPWLGVDGVLCC
jgi:hypothetical protein